MANFFDQFDEPKAQPQKAPGNFFDQFDAPASAPASQPAQFDTGRFDLGSVKNDPGLRQGMERVAAAHPSEPMGMPRAFGRGAAQGASLGFGDEASALAAASPIGQITEVLPIPGPVNVAVGGLRVGLESLAPSVFGSDGTKAYEAKLEEQRALNRKAEQDAPVSYIGGQVAGGVALPIAGAPAGAGMITRMGYGAGVGSAIGTVQGAGSGEGLEDRASKAFEGGWKGGALGGAAPVVLAGLGKGLSYAGDKFGIVRGAVAPENEAARRVSSALSHDAATGSGGLSRAELAAAQSDGVPAIVADLGGERTRALARSAANTSPEARDALTRVTSDRFATQSGRIADDVAGLSPLGADATASLDKLKAAAQMANRPAYARAYKEGSLGVWDDELAALTRAPDVADAIRKATRTGANKAVVDGFRPATNPFIVNEAGEVLLRTTKEGAQAVPTLQFWDHVKRNLDDTIEAAKRSGNRNAAADAIALKDSLVSKLDAAVPSYADARRGASAFFGAEDALEAGQKFVTATGKNADYAKAIGKMSEPEKKLFQEGFASALSARLRESSDRQNTITKLMNSPASRERVRMALGLEGSAKLEAKLRIESVMDTLRIALGNSTTTRQLVEIGMAGGVGGAAGGWQGGGDLKNIGLGIAMGAAAKYGVAKVDARVAQKVGDLLSSSDPKTMEKALAMAAKQPGVMKLIEAAEKYLIRLGGAAGGAMAR